ncbi:MAG: SDR family oxidoreductase [Magnetococcales bacterium]|nr:SDR family oxidoreductase [Magnetococcales bacterium]
MEIKSVVITGGAGGIGGALDRCLVARGVETTVIDIRGATDAGGKGVVRADVSREEEVGAAFAEIERRGVRFDGLVCCAGIVKDAPLVGVAPGSFAPYPLGAWSSTVAVNLTGTFLCVREFAVRCIRARRRSRVVTVSSPAACGAPGQAAYAASKAGVEAMTLAAAAEFAPWGVTLCCVRPGLTDTPMAAAYPRAVLDRLARRSSIGRIYSPEETAEAIVFCLFSDTVAGCVVPLDGGIKL